MKRIPVKEVKEKVDSRNREVVGSLSHVWRTVDVHCIAPELNMRVNISSEPEPTLKNFFPNITCFTQTIGKNTLDQNTLKHILELIFHSASLLLAVFIRNTLDLLAGEGYTVKHSLRIYTPNHTTCSEISPKAPIMIIITFKKIITG